MRDATENVQALLSQLRVEAVSPNKDSWKIFLRLTEDITIKGNLVPDALLAAILEANGVKRLYTHDTDFRKFPYLTPVDPLLDSR